MPGLRWAPAVYAQDRPPPRHAPCRGELRLLGAQAAALPRPMKPFSPETQSRRRVFLRGHRRAWVVIPAPGAPATISGRFRVGPGLPGATLGPGSPGMLGPLPVLAPEGVGELRGRAWGLGQRGATREVCPGKPLGAWPTRGPDRPWLRRTRGGRWARGPDYRGVSPLGFSGSPRSPEVTLHQQEAQVGPLCQGGLARRRSLSEAPGRN